MNQVLEIKSLLQQAATIPEERLSIFYKTGPGQYAAHDRFLGVTVPTLRQIAKKFKTLSLTELQIFIDSPFNEERLLALLILVQQYQIMEGLLKEEKYQFYLENLKQVNNWNLVDSSAHLILGAHLFQTDKSKLLLLAKSEDLWERRIAIVATWYFIRNNELSWTFKIAEMLLRDTQDLIHKAVGWMLREAGKRSPDHLIAFLEKHAGQMPRTMLRYAIEKFPEAQRKAYLIHGKLQASN